MSLYKKLFKQTAIYGLATVIPRMFSFILTPLYTTPGVMNLDDYADVSIIFSWLIFFNVVLAYGMETAFFRFYNKEDKTQVMSTSTISLVASSILFLIFALLFRKQLSWASAIDVQYVTLTIWILVLDALVIIPFSRLRAEGRPIFYAFVKISTVAFNVILNFFFLLWLPHLAKMQPDSLLAGMYVHDFEIGYVFLANLISSLSALLILLPHYFKIKWKFNKPLWKEMMRYAFPVMIAGVAFAVNEGFSRPLLQFMDVPKPEIAAYSACYRLVLFMTLFTTAYRLGIEPFFFSHSGNENATQTYATINKYFIIFGSIILLGVVVFADLFKQIFILDPQYWVAMDVVPLVVIGAFFLGIYTNLSVWYKLSDKTKMGAYISTIGAIVTLVFNIALIPFWGYMGSAIGTIGAYGAMMAISYGLGNKYYPIPYDIKTIGGYLGLSIVLSCVYFYGFRENYWVGGIVLVLFAAFLYKNEKPTLMRTARRKPKRQ